MAAEGYDYWQEEADLRKEASRRVPNKRKPQFQRPEGDDFIGIYDAITEHDDIVLQWRALAVFTETPRTNIVATEYIIAARALSEYTLALLFISDITPEQHRKIAAGSQFVITYLSDLWIFGVSPDETIDSDLDYLIWVSLHAVIAVKEYHAALEVRSPPVPLLKKGVIPETLQKKPVNSWRLSEFMLAFDMWIARWPILVLDEHAEKYTNDLRRQFCKIATNVFSISNGIIDYGITETIMTDEGPVTSIGQSTDKRVCASFREMYRELHDHRELLKNFRECKPATPMPKKCIGPIDGWLSLRSVTTAGNSANIVLKKFRTEFFYYNYTPGQRRRYRSEMVFNMGQEFESRVKPSFAALTSDRDLEFNALFPEEAKAFTDKYVNAGVEVVLESKHRHAFGMQACELVFLLGFAHTFDMHFGLHWLDTHFMFMPEPGALRDRSGRKYIIIVRYRGEYYLVHTDTMHAYACVSIYHAVYVWLQEYIQQAPTAIMRDVAKDLFNQIFVLGKYELENQRKKQDIYRGNALFRDPALLKKICRKN